MTLRKLLLEEMTRPEVERSIARGFTPVVVAAGAVEQHGPHLAAEGVAAALRDAP